MSGPTNPILHEDLLRLIQDGPWPICYPAGLPPLGDDPRWYRIDTPHTQRSRLAPCIDNNHGLWIFHDSIGIFTPSGFQDILCTADRKVWYRHREGEYMLAMGGPVPPPVPRAKDWWWDTILAWLADLHKQEDEAASYLDGLFQNAP